jgi:hypothetical protein
MTLAENNILVTKILFGNNTASNLNQRWQYNPHKTFHDFHFTTFQASNMQSVVHSVKFQYYNIHTINMRYG